MGRSLLPTCPKAHTEQDTPPAGAQSHSGSRRQTPAPPGCIGGGRLCTVCPFQRKFLLCRGWIKACRYTEYFTAACAKNPAAEKNHGCGQVRKEKTEKGKKNAAKCEKWLVYPGEIWYDVRRSGAGQRPLICGLAAVGPKACFCARRFL